MLESQKKIDLSSWVERERADTATYRQRQAIEIILDAISFSSKLRSSLFLKGGILMGLAYESPRLTADIDLTTSLEAGSDTGEQLATQLDSEFPKACARLGYANLSLQTQSIKKLPKNRYPDAKYPALKLTIAYVEKGGSQVMRFNRGESVDVIGIDISFNEPTRAIQALEIANGQELLAYSLIDLIAEKYRALLQQVSRRRNRRQDVYDLNILIAQQFKDDFYAEILDAFLEKCRSRGIEPNQSSLDNPEVKSRAKSDWHTLELEIGDLPDFENCFEKVKAFYKSFPW